LIFNQPKRRQKSEVFSDQDSKVQKFTRLRRAFLLKLKLFFGNGVLISLTDLKDLNKDVTV
jgi:hypothetical protein